METKLRLCEHFVSIQGESTQAGRPCQFFRFAGCNLNCSYCDTRYAQQADDGKEWSLEALLDLAQKGKTPLIELTGGEPLLQAGLPLFAKRLIDAGFEVMAETNGSLDIDLLPKAVRRIVDRKLPSSGMAEFHLEENYRKLTPHDELKFVMADRSDYEFARAEIIQFSLDQIGCPLLLSPVWGKTPFADFVGWILEDRLPVRFQLQMHKVIWDPAQTGV